MADDCAELENLRGFAKAVLGDWPEDCGVDGFDIQELAEKHGLLRPETRAEPCSDSCNCREYEGVCDDGKFPEPITCYRKVYPWMVETDDAD